MNNDWAIATIGHFNRVMLTLRIPIVDVHARLGLQVGDKNRTGAIIKAIEVYQATIVAVAADVEEVDMRRRAC